MELNLTHSNHKNLQMISDKSGSKKWAALGPGAMGAPGELRLKSAVTEATFGTWRVSTHIETPKPSVGPTRKGWSASYCYQPRYRVTRRATRLTVIVNTMMIVATILILGLTP